MGLLDLWDKENKESSDPMVYSKDYGYRRKSWLEKQSKSIKNKVKNKLKEWGWKNEDDDEVEASETTYNYGFNKKISEQNDSILEEYEKSGKWKGYEYYRKSTIDYRYIEQMANAFSSQHNIKIKIDKNWKIDIEKKELFYNPITLMFGTKAQVIVSLLHEIGHLRHTTPYNQIETKEYNKKYDRACFKILNLFEDLRIDKIMEKSYPGAKEIYEATTEIIKEQARQNEEKAKEIKKNISEKITDTGQSLATYGGWNSIEKSTKGYCKDYQLDEEKIKEIINIKGGKELIESINNLIKKELENKNIHEYIQGILLKSINAKDDEIPQSVLKEVKETEACIEKARNANNTQEVQNIIETEVFPKIEEILKNFQEGSEETKTIFGEHNAKRLQNGERELDFYNRDYKPREKIEEETRTKNKNQQGNNNSGADPGSDMPQEWAEGDYTSLKESVMSAIAELTRKLKNIKTKDLALKWKTQLTKGKLNIKDVYKYASGNNRFFKKREESTDRTQNFSFSIVVDKSGSMRGERIINATRGTILLAEVFKNLNIPFEIAVFGDYTEIIKKFDEEYKPSLKSRIGGIVKATHGGTDLTKIFSKSHINERKEKNKYMIILTDGDIYDINETKEKSKIITDKGVEIIGLCIETSIHNGLKTITENTKEITDANTIPTEFEEVLNKIIKKLK